jgi:uncharacterized flavoprotein (TIGR03862 family)
MSNQLPAADPLLSRNVPRVAVIGGGPAGLMAAEVLAQRGHAIEVFDAMPSPGRKFLLAGLGGMNITHSEALPAFLARYGSAADRLAPVLEAFGPAAIRDWMRELGVDSFVGSSGRVFPVGMKAAPLLRAWLSRLRATGVVLHARHRWLGWNADGTLRFAALQEGIIVERSLGADAVVLALGGGSWSKLGSDGAWMPLLASRTVDLAPLKPANCGFDVGGWSEHLRNRFAGTPVKSVALTVEHADGTRERRIGEFLLTDTGVEGSAIYALSAALRGQIERQGEATLWLDLLPDREAAIVEREVKHPRGSRSLSSHLQSRLGLKGIKMALLHELLPAETFSDLPALAAAIKALPLRLARPRPLDEAISSAGGVRFAELDGSLMLRKLPGVFCAGEMLDWEAPTGGYLLTACLATGRTAGLGAARWLTA